MRDDGRIPINPDEGNAEMRRPIVFYDLEMTGLDMEIACIVADGKLTKSMKGPHLVIQQSKDCLDKMDEWCQSHDAATGLTKIVLQSTLNESNAQKQDDESGTLNSITRLRECTLVAAESRFTSAETIADHKVNLLESDTESKSKRITRMGEWCQSHDAATGLTKKVLQSTLNESNSEKQDDESGTLNSIARLRECTLIAAESRFISAETIADHKVNLLESDTESKCKRITRRVCITASGSKRRNMGLWEYLKKTVNEDGDVMLVLNGVDEFLRLNTLIRRSSAITAFVVGYCDDLKKCVSFITGDHHETEFVDSIVESIGGGRSSAMHVLSNCNIEAHTSVEVATKHLMKALLWATFCDPNCGGILRVWKVESDLCEEVVALHAIDALLQYYSFSPTELLVFDCETYEKMNYHLLNLCLKSLNLSSNVPVVPGCFGYIKGDWKLHLVRLHNSKEVQCFFKTTAKVGDLTGVRQISFNGVSMYAVRATALNLYIARFGTYLDQF